MKRFVAGESRSQATLFPELLDDFVTEDNPVRSIEAFIDALDLRQLGFKGIDPHATGRPAYHPAVLLKIYLYGYLFVFPASDAPIDTRGALRLHEATRTSRTPITMERLAFFDVLEAPNQALPCRTAIFVTLLHVLERFPGKHALGLVRRGFGLREIRRNTGLMTRKNFITCKITAISDDVEITDAASIACLLGHPIKLTPVTADISDFMGDNQMMLAIDSRLNVVAHDSRSSRRHGASIWVRQRDLLIRGLDPLNFNGLQLLNFFCEGGDLFLQSCRLRFCDNGGALVHCVELA